MKKEGNAWFQRNKKALHDFHILTKDNVLRLIREAGIIPKKALEAGCSNGWRLGEIERQYGCECLGVDASRKAISDGEKRYPNIIFKYGNIASLPIKNECFDLVIVHFVFHWVARDLLLKSVAEIDRIVADGGFLILGDFLPDKPLKNYYHHLPAREVYTYKLDYTNIFISSGLYKVVGKVVFDHDNRDNQGEISPYSRAGCFLLKKSIHDFYELQTGNHQRKATV